MKALQILLLLLFVLLVESVNGQEIDSTRQVYLVKMNKNVAYIGTVVSRDLEKITLKTETLGTIELLWVDIEQVRPLEDEIIYKGRLYFDNPQATRYFYGPNGYGLKKGEGYYQNVLLVFNQVSYGATEYFSIGVGMIPLFLVRLPSPVWVTPKFSAPIIKNKLNVGIGGLFGTVLLEDNTSFGVGYGTITYGNRHTNMNLSVGYSRIGGSWSEVPVFGLSGMARLTPKTYLISENWFLPGLSMVSFGARALFSKTSIDFGLVVPVSENVPFGIAVPWLGIAVGFGKK